MIGLIFRPPIAFLPMLHTDSHYLARLFWTILCWHRRRYRRGRGYRCTSGQYLTGDFLIDKYCTHPIWISWPFDFPKNGCCPIGGLCAKIIRNRDNFSRRYLGNLWFWRARKHYRRDTNCDNLNSNIFHLPINFCFGDIAKSGLIARPLYYLIHINTKMYLPMYSGSCRIYPVARKLRNRHIGAADCPIASNISQSLPVILVSAPTEKLLAKATFVCWHNNLSRDPAASKYWYSGRHERYNRLFVIEIE